SPLDRTKPFALFQKRRKAFLSSGNRSRPIPFRKATHWMQGARLAASLRAQPTLLQLVLPPANALRHQAALLGESLDAQTALAPRDENASRLVLRPLTSVCHAGRSRSRKSDPRGRIVDRALTCERGAPVDKAAGKADRRASRPRCSTSTISRAIAAAW